jgi:hypothetical protein
MLGGGIALAYFLSTGVGYGWEYGLGAALHYELNYRLIAELSVWMSYGLIFGITSILVNLILKMQSENVHLSERLRWTWRSLIRSLLTLRHLRATALLASIVLALIGLSYGLYYGLLAGPLQLHFLS